MKDVIPGFDQRATGLLFLVLTVSLGSASKASIAGDGVGDTLLTEVTLGCLKRAVMLEYLCME